MRQNFLWFLFCYLAECFETSKLHPPLPHLCYPHIFSAHFLRSAYYVTKRTTKNEPPEHGGTYFVFVVSLRRVIISLIIVQYLVVSHFMDGNFFVSFRPEHLKENVFIFTRYLRPRCNIFLLVYISLFIQVIRR